MPKMLKYLSLRSFANMKPMEFLKKFFVKIDLQEKMKNPKWKSLIAHCTSKKGPI